MKKLMIAAAAAAMVSGAFAIDQSQAYDYTATIKTGACKDAKVSAKLLAYFQHNGRFTSVWRNAWERGDEIGIRKQASVKIAGVIWGCDCPTIAAPGWRTTPARYLGGYYFWNQQSEELYNPLFTTFQWDVLNRIDTTMTKCEGAYTFIARQPGQQLRIVGAGFGTVAKTGCDTYIKSISGNLAGYRREPIGEFGCRFCWSSGCVVAPLCDQCWEFFFITNPLRNVMTFTAVTGTWKIKYNAKVSKALKKMPWISRVYTFKKGGITATYAEFVDRAWSILVNRPYGADDDGDNSDEISDWAEDYTNLDFASDIFGEIVDNIAEMPESVTKVAGKLPSTVFITDPEDFEDYDEDEYTAFMESIGEGDAS